MATGVDTKEARSKACCGGKAKATRRRCRHGKPELTSQPRTAKATRRYASTRAREKDLAAQDSKSNPPLRFHARQRKGAQRRHQQFSDFPRQGGHLSRAAVAHEPLRPPPLQSQCHKPHAVVNPRRGRAGAPLRSAPSGEQPRTACGTQNASAGAAAQGWWQQGAKASPGATGLKSSGASRSKGGVKVKSKSGSSQRDQRQR